MPETSSSLDNLRDIVIPEPPPLWPPAPGVWVLLIVVLAVLLGLFLWWRRSRERNAYRRAGLALLSDARTNREVNVILKRVALAVFPRSEVASLYDDDWAAFLGDNCSRTQFRSLGPAEAEAAPTDDVRRLARTWIQHHRAPAPVRGGGN